MLCGACGAWSVDPPQGDDELDSAYGGWYRRPEGRFAGFGDRLLRQTRGSIARRIDRIAPPGPVLDVGAGEGALLDALRARDRVARGIDRHRSHPDVEERDLLDTAGTWAAIVFWHTLEHLRDAGRSLDHAASLLEPRGVLIVTMPNASSLQATVFGDDWFGLDYPRHLVHVPATVLLDRLETLGLSVGRVSYWRGGQVIFGWLHGLTGRLPGHPDLYDAIRRPRARQRPMRSSQRLATLLAAAILFPFALLASTAEVALRRSGTVYVEARRV